MQVVDRQNTSTGKLQELYASFSSKLGWYGGGVIADGALADFVVVRDDTVRTVGSRAGQILYTATAADVATVVVAGAVVAERGEHARLGPVAPLFRDVFDTLRVDR